jgi:hypothetical protein
MRGETLDAQRGIEVVHAELQVVIAGLVGHEPGEHVVGAVGHVEPAIGPGGLLIAERQVVQRGIEDFLIVAVGVEVGVAEEDVLTDGRDAERIHLGRSEDGTEVPDEGPIDVGFRFGPRRRPVVEELDRLG